MVKKDLKVKKTWCVNKSVINDKVISIEKSKWLIIVSLKCIHFYYSFVAKILRALDSLGIYAKCCVL